MNFMNKNRQFRRKKLRMGNINFEGDDDVDDEDDPATLIKKTRIGSIAHRKIAVSGYLRMVKIRKARGGIKVEDKTYNVNYDDLVEDLSRNVKRKPRNLSKDDLNVILPVLKKRGMPSSLITNYDIKRKYLRIKKPTSRIQPVIPAHPPPPGTPTTSTFRRRTYLTES